jgi:transketolase
VVSKPVGVPELVLIGTGSELQLVVAAADTLASEGRRVQVVSLPCLSLFERQDQAYRDQVLPPGSLRLSIEAGRTEPWLRWVGERGVALGIDRYGASAPDKVIAEKLGLTPVAVLKAARKLLANAG